MLIEINFYPNVGQQLIDLVTARYLETRSWDLNFCRCRTARVRAQANFLSLNSDAINGKLEALSPIRGQYLAHVMFIWSREEIWGEKKSAIRAQIRANRRNFAQTGAILKSVHFRIYFIKFDMAEMWLFKTEPWEIDVRLAAMSLCLGTMTCLGWTAVLFG